MTQDKAQAAGAVSIDSPEFRNLVLEFGRALKLGQQTIGEHASLVDHIDAHAAQHYEAGHQAGLAHAVQTIKNSNDTASIALKQRDEAQASLARLVEGIEGLPRHEYVGNESGGGVDPSPDGNYIERDDLLALLPAKAEAPTLICQRCDTDRLKAPCPISGDLCSVARADAHLLATPAPAMGDEKIDYRYLNLDTGRYVDSQSELTEQVGPGGMIKSFMHFPKGIFVVASHGDFTEVQANLAAKKIREHAAMGEELPPHQQDAEYKMFCAAHRAAISKTVPNANQEMTQWHADRHWNGKPGEMWRARACMALRQPGAEKAGGLPDCSHPFRTGDAIEVARGGGICAICGDILTVAPAAPVSQPAAQEVVAYLDLAKLRVGGMAYATAFRTGPKQVELFTAPAPLSAPAESEQEKNAARYLELRNHHHMDDFGDGWLYMRFACGDKYTSMTEDERGAALDAEVDAALAAQQKNGS